MQRKQFKRRCIGKRNNLKMINLGDSNVIKVFFTNKVMVPRGFFRFFKKFFKKNLKKRKIKCLVITHLNYSFSKKSKNSRMGKGVGTPTRRVHTFSMMRPSIVVYNASPKKIKNMLFFLKKRLPIKTTIMLPNKWSF